MGKVSLQSAIDKLKHDFLQLNWQCHDILINNKPEKIYCWPGEKNEEIIICIHRSNNIKEPFHRHNFFYFNYTYSGQYDSISYKYDNKITIKENELYAGQPFAGHALCVHDDRKTTIIGVLIQKNTFFHSFLPMLNINSSLFNFFIEPETKNFADEFIHFKIDDNCNIRQLLEMMVVEYAYKQRDTQQILKPLALSFLTQIIRQYAAENVTNKQQTLTEKIFQFIAAHFDTVTLQDVAREFSYHPNYISSFLKNKTGKSFSQLVTQQRMNRAEILLKQTDLSVEQIASVVGYSNSSNFYKIFKEYHGVSPRRDILLQSKKAKPS